MRYIDKLLWDQFFDWDVAILPEMAKKGNFILIFTDLYQPD